MDTPIYDFVKEYVQKEAARLHMPGHKGRGPLGCEAFDITEIQGADHLFHTEGIIKRSEANATKLFGSRQTFFATGGASQCIGAMLYLLLTQTAKEDGRITVLAGRNAHKSFLDGCALLDLDVEWIYPKEAGDFCACPITAGEVEEKILSMEKKPAALYVTSPDYLGGRLDIQRLAGVCRRYEMLLLVDNAHGAYLKFLSPSQHPLDLGADICCDSAHKTLPVLTGGAYLHVALTAPEAYERQGKNALALFGSTSPSYLTLQSLDLCNAALAKNYPIKLRDCIAKGEVLKERLKSQTIFVRESEPLKLVIDCAKMGWDGQEAERSLAERGIVAELADRDHIVFMFSPQNKEEDFVALEAALGSFKAATPRERANIVTAGGIKKMGLREATLAKQEEIPTCSALGRICATATVSCPPAIPIAIAGEEISRDMIDLFLEYGIERIWVVTKKQ